MVYRQPYYIMNRIDMVFLYALIIGAAAWIVSHAY